MLELADGRMTAGASRLIYSVAILLVLAFGALVGHRAGRRARERAVRRRRRGHAPVLGRVGWLGDLRARHHADVLDAPADFPWALGLILLTAAVAQLATRASGEVVGTFVAAIVMTAAAVLARAEPAAPARVHHVPRCVLRADARLARAARIRELARRAPDPGLPGRGRHGRCCSPRSRSGCSWPRQRCGRRDRHRARTRPHRRWLPFDEPVARAGGSARPSRGSAGSRWPWSCSS